jgi:outer membrane protein TolC
MKHRYVCCGLAATLITLITLPASAQSKQWSLRECCDYAVAHNVGIKQQENQCRQREIELSTSRNSRLPDLSGSVSQNFSFGRGLTAENTYTNTNTSSTSLQLGASMPLFTGFQIPNQIKLNQLNLEAATADLELVTVPQFSGADEQLWRIEQLTDGTFRIMPKRIPGHQELNKNYVIYSAADSTPTLAVYDFQSDNSKWNIRNR